VLALLARAALAAPAPGTLTIAAAADLQTALPDIAMQFEKATGIKTTLTFGSSGSFFAQIQNGAPFDLFFSADADYPRRLAAGGHIDAASVYDYATGRLVLWTRNDSGVDIAKGLPLLRDGHIRHVAIANPALAPYGRAAVAALRSAGLFDGVSSKLVYAENVSQAAQLAQSGNAEVALIGHALALGASLRNVGRFVDLPERMHPPIVQAVGIVSRSRNKENAQAFVNFLKGPEGGATLRAFGFLVPGRP
jgi:molybdate transport system substrate-binding protein